MKFLFAAAGAAALTPLILVPSSTASSAPASAQAAAPVWLKLSAYTAKPDAKVSVQAACEGVAGPLSSKALRVVAPLARNAEGHQPWALFALGVVADVPPGTYPVSFTCDGATVGVRFTVPLPRHAAPSAQVRVVPHGAPQTGGGGTAA